MKRAVLIFGAFNPVTNAHINMGIDAKKLYPDADIIYVPASNDFLKSWKKFDSKEILDREKLLTESLSYSGFFLSFLEILNITDGKTYNTVNFYKENLGYDEVIICLGSDKLCELDLWDFAEELIKENKFLILIRDGKKGELPKEFEKYSDNFRYIEGEYQSVSSTKVREAWKKGDLESVKNFIPDPVYKYLKERKVDNV